MSQPSAAPMFPVPLENTQQARCWDILGVQLNLIDTEFHVLYLPPSPTLFLCWMPIPKDQIPLFVWRHFYTLALFWEFNMYSGHAIGRLDRKHCVLESKAANWIAHSPLYFGRPPQTSHRGS